MSAAAEMGMNAVESSPGVYSKVLEPNHDFILSVANLDEGLWQVMLTDTLGGYRSMFSWKAELAVNKYLDPQPEEVADATED